MALSFKTLFRKKQKAATGPAAAASPKSSLLTIADPAHTPQATGKKPKGSIGRSFASLMHGKHMVRNMSMLVVTVLVAGGAVLFTTNGELLQGLFVSTQTYERPATMKLKPEVGDFSIGDTVDVEVLINTAGKPSEGADILLSYDSTVLEVVDSDSAQDGAQIKKGTLYPQYGGNIVDPSQSTIALSGFIPFGGTPVTTTRDEVFATITFKALKAAASTQVTFQFANGSPNPFCSEPICANESSISFRLGEDEVGDMLGAVTDAVFGISGSVEELFIEITTEDGDDFGTDEATVTLKGITSPRTVKIEVNGDTVRDYDAGDERWSADIDLDEGENDIEVTAFDADDETADDDITITYGTASAPTGTSKTDTDRDGIIDSIERKYGLNAEDPLDGATDNDGDGCTNVEEFINGTDPTNPDTDNDGIPDCVEVRNRTNPNDANDAQRDDDGDGCSNKDEYLRSTDSRKPDTDGDGITDCDDENPLVADLSSGPSNPTTPTTEPKTTPTPTTPTPQPTVTMPPVVAPTVINSLTNDGPETTYAVVLLAIAIAAGWVAMKRTSARV